MINLQFKPSLAGTLATMLCIPLFIHLGMWQYNKAEQKQVLQAQYDANGAELKQGLPADLSDVESMRYQQLVLDGEYLTQYQILLDNQVEGESAGYHVITPLKLNNQDQVVLIDRGWIAATDNHSDLPAIETPVGPQKVQGQIWVPSKKFYTLAPQTSSDNKWQSLWQNMDMVAYAKAVPFKVAPVVLRMSPDNSGGFVRNWVRPDDRIATHLGYAYQWFGFAAAALGIYLFVSFKRKK